MIVVLVILIMAGCLGAAFARVGSRAELLSALLVLGSIVAIALGAAGGAW